MTGSPEYLHDIRFPGESDDYRQARDALLRAEKDVRDHTEEVARQRRELPLGGVAPTDYTFQEWDTGTGSRRAVTLSELFEDGKDTLFLYSFMFIAGPGRRIRSARRARTARRSSTRSPDRRAT